jgi:hypothetical protein
VFPVETHAVGQCAALWHPEGGGKPHRCELGAGHDRGAKASPHMVDQGDGVPPLTWTDENPSEIGEPLADAAKRTADAVAERVADQISGRDASAGFEVQDRPDGPVVFGTLERLHALVFQAAGAATRPFMEDHPDYVFPSERVSAGVGAVLTDFGIPEIAAYPRDASPVDVASGLIELPPGFNPPEAPQLDAGANAVTFPFITVRVNDTGRTLQGQLVERPEIVTAADTIPELQDALWGALQAWAAAQVDVGYETAGWHVRYTFDVWSGQSQIDSREGQMIVLTDGTIDQAVDAVRAHLEQNAGGGPERAENVEATWVRRLGPVIVG